jgi:NAD(P)-dependent dehydrogenase (short-subunit alcohol dehydrogenase family)
VARNLRDAVVVITGASSGIGRAAARAFAAKGANLVLAARREQPLREIGDTCTQAGVRALAVPTDVSDGAQVEALAERAADAFGRIDVWVNNAGVAIFGRFEEVPPEVYRRVIDVNLLGYINGARAALPHFREQGEGVLINNSSVVAYIGEPYTSAYVVSQFGIRGFSECLRQELLDAPDIHVCVVLPATIDTPLFRHAANYSGRAADAMSPIYSAEMTADAIVRLARRPRRELIVGRAGRAVTVQHAVAPGLSERMMARSFDRHHLQHRPAPPTPGNLFEPMEGWTGTSGGWEGVRPEKASSSLLLGGLLLAGGAALGAYALRRNSRPRASSRS